MKHKWRLDKNGVPDDWAWESGFHNGVYCERCGKTVCVHCDPDWEEMDDCEVFEREPMTNADRIRAMSDEELAEFMAERYSNERTANILGSLIGEGYVVTEAMRRALHEKMRMQWLDWLRQPVKDGEDDG